MRETWVPDAAICSLLPEILSPKTSRYGHLLPSLFFAGFSSSVYPQEAVPQGSSSASILNTYGLFWDKSCPLSVVLMPPIYL